MQDYCESSKWLPAPHGSLNVTFLFKMLENPAGHEVTCPCKESEVNMKNLINEVFNSKMYEFVTIHLTGETLPTLKIENVEVLIRENYFVLNHTYEVVDDVFVNHPPVEKTKTYFIPYNKIVEIKVS